MRHPFIHLGGESVQWGIVNRAKLVLMDEDDKQEFVRLCLLSVFLMSFKWFQLAWAY